MRACARGAEGRGAGRGCKTARARAGRSIRSSFRSGSRYSGEVALETLQAGPCCAGGLRGSGVSGAVRRTRSRSGSRGWSRGRSRLSGGRSLTCRQRPPSPRRRTSPRRPAPSRATRRARWPPRADARARPPGGDREGAVGRAGLRGDRNGPPHIRSRPRPPRASARPPAAAAAAAAAAKRRSPARLYPVCGPRRAAERAPLPARTG